jgi:hypothetical protein
MVVRCRRVTGTRVAPGGQSKSAIRRLALTEPPMSISTARSTRNRRTPVIGASNVAPDPARRPASHQDPQPGLRHARHLTQARGKR